MYAIRSYYAVHDEIDNPFIIVVIGMGRYRVGKLTEPEEIHRRGDVEDDIGQAWTDAGIDMLFRITSYNVCYTKLLRSAAGREDRSVIT